MDDGRACGRRARAARDVEDVAVARPLTGGRGPQPIPSAFNLSSPKMLDSLTRIQGPDTQPLLFGRGEP